ncbi:MAG: site-specific DNA-methyltransferase [Gammaproteobacteria bacterium]|nr:site-specific DNA-methyltransferase [Gammaproteobacteria bacterium]MCY4276914.1 site-specific DNA-methyltransferase [Gammaproteobacteria bacterium]
MSVLTATSFDEGLRRVMEYAPPVENANPCVLVQGDATRKDTLLAGCADLVVTSPPYNVGKEYDGTEEGDALSYKDYLKFTKRWLRNCYHWTRTTGRLCINVSIDKNRNGKQPLSADVTRLAMDVGWKYHATIVWNEGNISRRTAWGSWMSASAPHIIAPVEVIIVLYKDEWKRERQGTSDITRDEFMEWVFGIWTFNGESAKRIGHEAPFPRVLPERLIKLLSFPGDTVLDPFAGSGTTLIEAVNRGRNAIGVEIEDNYCQLTLDRIKTECEASLTESKSAARPAKYMRRCWVASTT